MFEAVGSYAAGTMTEEEVREYEEKVCPTCGSCSGMYTANSMNCLTEALGMGLRGNGTIPAVYSERIKLSKTCRNGSYGYVSERYPSKRYYDKGCYFKCTDRRYGVRLLYQQYASSSCNRT